MTGRLRGWRTVGAAIGLLLATGCRMNEQQTKLQFMPDMADAPTVKAQEDFLPPPVGAVAMNAILYPKSAEDAERLLVMPATIAGDPQAIDKGRELYNTYCSLCHGPKGKGAGTVTDLFARPPDLTHQVYDERGDGFFFYRITFGSAIMPSYGHATEPYERWQIVHYLRTLQAAEQ